MTLDELIVKLGYEVDDAALSKFNQGLEKTEQRAQNFSTKMAGIGKAVGAGLVAGGAAATVAVNKFAGVERTLTRIAINGDVSRDRIAQARAQMQGLADDFAFEGLDEPVRALDQLIARGMDFDSAMANLPAVLATTQAAGADAAEVANSAFSIAEGFGVAAYNMDTAFDILAKGGKEGAFELRDMAGTLPSLIPQMRALGYEGLDGLRALVALMQTVRLETGTSAEAATNLQNVLAKMESQETINKFEKEFGVDLPGAIEQGLAEGKSKIDAFLDVVQDTVGDDIGLLNKLFIDQQLQKGVRALIGNRDDLSGFEAAMLDAVGTVEADLERVLEDTQASLDRMFGNLDRFTTEAGAALAPTVNEVVGSLADRIAISRKANEIRRDDGMGLLARSTRSNVDSNVELLMMRGGDEGQALVAGYLGEDSEQYAELVRKKAMAGISGDTSASATPTAPQPQAQSAPNPMNALSSFDDSGRFIGGGSPSSQPDPSRFGGGTSPAPANGMADLQARLENMNANIARITPESAVDATITDARVSNDNRQFPMQTTVTVNQTVTSATDAPGAAARATGNAAAGAANAQRSRITSTPTTSGNGPQ